MQTHLKSNDSAYLPEENRYFRLAFNVLYLQYVRLTKTVLVFLAIYKNKCIYVKPKQTSDDNLPSVLSFSLLVYVVFDCSGAFSLVVYVVFDCSGAFSLVSYVVFDCSCAFSLVGYVVFDCSGAFSLVGYVVFDQLN